MKKITGTIKWWLLGSLMLAGGGGLAALTLAPSAHDEPSISTDALDTDAARAEMVASMVQKGWTQQMAACYADVASRQSDELGVSGAVAFAQKICGSPPQKVVLRVP